MEINSESRVSKIQVKNMTLESRRALCEEWKSSGLKASEFCKQKGLARPTFHGWCTKLGLNAKNKKRDLNKKNNRNWIPLSCNNDQPPELQGLKLVEIKVSNQMMMRLSLSMDDIQLLLKGLCNATTIIR